MSYHFADQSRASILVDPVDPRPETAAAAVAVTTTIAQASRGELLPTETLGRSPAALRAPSPAPRFEEVYTVEEMEVEDSLRTARAE